MQSTKSWATLVCSAVLLGGGVLGAGAASAAGLDCGTPAQPAVYTTVAHPAVPAVTGLETVVDVAAKAAVTHDEAQWQRTVVVTPGVPAVDEQTHTETAYVDGYGAPEGDGWSRTGENRTVVDQEAWDETVTVPATYVTERQWRQQVVDQPGQDATYRTDSADTESSSPPEGDGWTLEGTTGEAAYSEQVLVKEAWTEKVIDQAYVPAKPAVMKVLVKWVERGGNDFVWLPQGDPGPSDYTLSNDTEETVLEPATPEVPEISHDVVHPAVYETVNHESTLVWHWTRQVVDQPAQDPTYTWVYQWSVESPGADWSQTYLTREVVDVPAHDEVIHHPEVTHQQQEWTRAVVDAPAQDAVEAVTDTETTWLPVGESPEGDGWSLTGATKTVTDQDAVAEQSHTEKTVVTPAVAAWGEQVLVSAAVPAGDECPAAPDDTNPAGGPASPAVEAPAAPVQHVSLPQAPSAPAPQSDPVVPRLVHTDGGQLAHTGSGDAGVAGAGLLMTLLGGLLLLLRPRSRRSE
jgi:hypothetical protein